MAAFTINSKFYHSFTGGDGKSYKLWFIPGHWSDLSTPDEIEFPQATILPGITVKTDFDNGLPVGRMNMAIMNLKINLENFDDEGTTNYSDLRDWIIRSRSTSQVTYSTLSFYIPNMWALENVTDGDFDFVGFQIEKIERDFEFTLNKVEFEIEAVCSGATTMQKFKYSLFDSLTGTYTKKSTIQLHWVSGGIDRILSRYHDAATLHIRTVQDYRDNLTTALGGIYDDLSRGLASSVAHSNLIDSWEFYKQDELNPPGYTGTALADSAIFLIFKILRDGDIIAGLLSENSSEMGFSAYSNHWNAAKWLFEGLFEKMTIVNNGFGGFNVYVNSVFEAVSARSDAEKTISKSWLIKPPKLKTGFKYKSISNYHLKDSLEGDINMFSQEIDSSFSDDSFESQSSFQNTINTCYKALGGKTLQAYLERFIVRGLYYIDTAGRDWGDLYKVSDYCNLDVDGGTTSYSVNADYDSFHLPDWHSTKFASRLNQWILKRQGLAGIPYVVNSAIIGEFANPLQGEFELEIGPAYFEKFKPKYLGDTYIFNPNDLLPGGAAYLYPAISNDCVLTSIENDYSAGVSKVKLFVRSN